jgi:hypothetical protein
MQRTSQMNETPLFLPTRTPGCIASVSALSESAQLQSGARKTASIKKLARNKKSMANSDISPPLSRSIAGYGIFEIRQIGFLRFNASAKGVLLRRPS